jgi:hypothetical protein
VGVEGFREELMEWFASLRAFHIRSSVPLDARHLIATPRGIGNPTIRSSKCVCRKLHRADKRLTSTFVLVGLTSSEEADMKKSITFSLAIVMVFTAWLVEAKKKEVAPDMYLVTSFDFASYPACQSDRNSDCILAIRFYDADSNQRLAEVETTAAMRGRQTIVGRANGGAIPRRAYAVTVYLDDAGSRKEGPRGQISELRRASESN